MLRNFKSQAISGVNHGSINKIPNATEGMRSNRYEEQLAWHFLKEIVRKWFVVDVVVLILIHGILNFRSRNNYYSSRSVFVRAGIQERKLNQT